MCIRDSVESAEEAREFLRVLNGQHSAIRFELEGCTEDGDSTSLSLLDLTIRFNRAAEAAFDFYTKEAKSSIFMHRESVL